MDGKGTWMSQEVSKRLVNGLFHLPINGVIIPWGYNPRILAFDPNFQRDILLLMEEILHHLGCIKPYK